MSEHRKSEHRKNIYIEEGYADRRDYLKSLADDFGIAYEVVKLCADILGTSEDFDGLVTCLEDEMLMLSRL